MVDQLTSLPRSVLMVETSGASSLNPRQACSVEAAARRSVDDDDVNDDDDIVL